MSELLVQILGGLIVIVIASRLGLGGTTKVTVQSGTTTKKTGKWIMIISVVAIVGGLAWAGSNSPAQGGLDFSKAGTIYGLTLAGYGALFYFVGKFVAWFQRP